MTIWQRRQFAQVTSRALRLATTYLPREPIIDEDPASADFNRLFLSDGVTPGGNGLAFVSDLSFQGPGTGAVARTFVDKMRDRISVLDFIPQNLHAGILGGANTAATTDLRLYIQAAINYVQGLGGGELWFPPGWYSVSANTVGAYCLFLSGNVTLRAAPWSAYIIPNATAGTTIPVIKVYVAAGIVEGLRVEGMGIGNPTTLTRYGQVGIEIDAPADQGVYNAGYIRSLIIRDNVIFQGASASIAMLNPNGQNGVGGIQMATIEHNHLLGGITLNWHGDSNTIRRNFITDNVGYYTIGVDASQVAGASVLVIDDNNITTGLGIIRIRGGSRFRITNNNCEIIQNAGVIDGAMIDIGDDLSSGADGLVQYNHLGALATGVSSFIRARNHIGLRIDHNDVISDSGSQVVIDLDTCTSTYVGRQTSGTFTSGGVSGTITAMVNDGPGCVGTMGVLKPATLQNLWVAAAGFQAPSFIKTEDGMVHLFGSIASGTDGVTILTLPAGFRPASVLPFVTGSQSVTASITVRPDGTVTAAGVNATRTDLNNIRFPAADLGNATAAQ